MTVIYSELRASSRTTYYWDSLANKITGNFKFFQYLFIYLFIYFLLIYLFIYLYSLKLSIFDLQPAPATCNLQPATCNLQPANYTRRIIPWFHGWRPKAYAIFFEHNPTDPTQFSPCQICMISYTYHIVTGRGWTVARNIIHPNALWVPAFVI